MIEKINCHTYYDEHGNNGLESLAKCSKCIARQ